jgi:arylsulfatase A
MKRLIFAGLSAGLTAGGAAERPNILFIMTDDLGVRDLGCYGSDYYRTPNLDALAAQGMLFTRAYAACTVCSPTRASLLTGRYPHRVRLTDALPWDRLFENPKLIPPEHLKELPAELPNVARALRDSGYRTALFGKWHLGNEHNFFDLKGYEAYGFDEAFDAHWKIKNEVDKGVEVLTERSLRFLEENRDHPFLLCLMHHTPHVPLACPPEYEALYDDVPKGRFQKDQKYAGLMSHLDRSVKTVLDQLDELGLAQNTVVIFTSDNGGLQNLTSNLPFRGGKGDLYEGGLRVPLIVRWPGRIAPGSVCEVPVHTADYFPTFLELAGLAAMPEAHVDGTSLLPLWSGRPAEPRTLFWHFPHRQNPSSVVMEGDWKLVRYDLTGKQELFDLKADPEETNDLAEAHPERADRLARMLETHLQAAGAQRMRPNPDWNSARPPGKLRNFGTFHPAGGTVYRQIQEPLPEWFRQNPEEYCP